MTHTITLDEPAFGYYEDADGVAIAKFDLPAGEHRVGEEIANAVVMENRGAWQQKQVTGGSGGGESGRDWAAEWADATSPEDKLQLIGERFFDA
jgi:hypothetical protein